MEGDFESTSEAGIAALVIRSLALFESLALALKDDHAQASQVRLYLSRFKLWAGSLGAHRGSGGRSLEYRLRDASHIRKLVISLLSDLCSSIERGVLIINQGIGSDTASDSYDQVENDLADYFNDVEDSDKSETAKTLDEIAHVISCLLRLSITISNPLPHSQFLAREDDDLIESYVHWDAKHVREKFGSVSEHLANRLGRAMARRRLYFRYLEEHRNRLAQGLVEGENEDEQATTVASSLPDHLKKVDETCSTSLVIADDASPNASVTSYATSNPNSAQLRVPPLPKEYSDGPFKCSFCQNIVSIDTRYDWKKHVFRDLRPYVCLSNVCKTPEHLYMRRREWIVHMKREHWRMWLCPFGCNAEYVIPEDFHKHIEVSHKHDISSDKIHALVELSSVPNVAKAKGQCPLCFDFQIISDKQYEKHIGRHLEQLALFTLPNIGEDERDDEEGKQSGSGEENNDSDNGEDTGMTIEDAVASLNHYAEKATAAEKQKETEAQIRREAEEAFARRMEDMRLAQESARKEIERARFEAERAGREERAQEHDQVLAEAEEKARFDLEAQMKAAQERRKAGYKALNELDDATRKELEANLKAAKDQRKAAAEARAEAERKARQDYDYERKVREDYERRVRGDYDTKAK